MDQKSAKPNQKRRAILQGSLAAPVVLTVSSASATTMTTLGKCLGKLANENPPFFVEGTGNLGVLAAPDGWLRTQVTLVQLLNGSTPLPGEYFLDPYAGYVNVANMSAPTETWTTAASTSGRRWALVWFDIKTGQRVGQIRIQKPSLSTAASATCYASVNPGAQQ